MNILVFIALLIIAFLVGHFFGDKVIEVLRKFFVWLGQKIWEGLKKLWGLIFKKKE
jgi:hypothetical protein